MSRNIETEIIKGELRITGLKLDEVQQALKKAWCWPEDCFLHYLPCPVEDDEGESQPGTNDHTEAESLWFPDSVYIIDDLTWRGEGSGSSLSFLLEKVLPHTTGSIDFVVHWEGGGIEGFRVVEGDVSKRTVNLTLD
jgi:hypothetical protein